MSTPGALLFRLIAGAQMFNVLIADDHSLIRSAVKLLLQNQGYRVVAEAVNGIDTIQLARQFAPDLIVLDITMPGLDGLEVIGRLKASGITSRVLVLTS